MKKTLRILGTRGIPAQHGGFETFAEHLALYLVDHGWEVIVYCQEEGTGKIYEDSWNNVRLIHMPIQQSGALGTIIFDWKSTLHASKSKTLILTLGYNTAVFCTIYRLKGIKNIINMDGIEWKRDKWSSIERGWLYLNERTGCHIGNHLVADHPEIMKHLETRVKTNKITMIPYGSDTIRTANCNLIKPFGLEPGKYAIVIARPEPENSILEIVTAYSMRRRNIKLVVVGNYDPSASDYHRAVIDSASEEVCFLGAIYDKPVIQSLRFHALLYIHGHTVGGTNPSLVESLGAGNAVLAHNNKYNRWVAGKMSWYFTDMEDCESKLRQILTNKETADEMRIASKLQHQQKFTWNKILNMYEKLFEMHNNS